MLLPHLERLFNACLFHGYHPKSFKESITVVLKKPKEDADFTIPKNWRPIALLSTIGKALEAVIRSTHQLGHGGVVQARDCSRTQFEHLLFESPETSEHRLFRCLQ